MKKRPRAPSDGLEPRADVVVLIEQIHIEIEPELVFEEAKVIKQEPECEDDLPDDCGLSKSEMDYCGAKVKDDQSLSPELQPSPDWPSLPLAPPDGGWAQNVEEKPHVGKCSVKVERIKDEEEPLKGLSLSQRLALRDCEVRLTRVAAAGTVSSAHSVGESRRTLPRDRRLHDGNTRSAARARRWRCGQPLAAHALDARTNAEATCTAMYAEATPYSTFSTLMEHDRIHSGVKRYSCKLCKKKFTRPCNLDRHQQIHTGEKPYSCTICKNRFTQSYDLKKHNRIHTGEKPYPCKICKKRFRELSHLNRHLRIHTDEKPHPCKICNKRFRQSSDLKRHLRVHTGQKPYACKICNNRFRDSSNLKAHLRIHTGEKPYACKLCNDRFIEPSSLKRHLVHTHTGEKPYACKICNNRFIQSSSLMRHLRIHTGEKPHECKICKVRFTQSSSLKRHKIVHTNPL